MDLMDYRRKIVANSPHLASASGAIASFSDGADLPLKSLNVDIEPVQDLHGYDYPWVGGRGKNLFSFGNISVKNIYRANVQQMGTDPNAFYLAGAMGNSNNMQLLVNSWSYVCTWIDYQTTAETTITVSCKVKNYSADCNGFIRIRYGDTQAKTGSTSAAATNFNDVGQYQVIVTATIPSGKYVGLEFSPASKGSEFTLTQFTEITEFQLEVGSSATSYAPYENICPITGWNGVKVTRSDESALKPSTAFTETKNGLTFTSDGKGTYSVKGTNTATETIRSAILPVSSFTIPPSTTHTLYINNNAINSGVFLSFMIGSTAIDSWAFNALNRVSTSYGAMGNKLCDGIQIVVRAGQTVDITFSPMLLPKENTDVIIRSGGNLFNPHAYTGIAYNPTVGDTVTLTDSATQFTDNGNGVFTVTTSSTWRYFNIVIPIDPTKEYATKIVFSSTGQVGVTRGYLDADFKILTKFNSTDSPTSWEYSLIPETNAAYYYFIFTNRGTASATLTLTQPQFVEGTTVGNYDPYTGTIYGATINPLTGVLTVDRGYSELSENWNWSRSTSFQGGYYTNKRGDLGYRINTPFICSHAKSVASTVDYIFGTCYCDSTLNFRIMATDSTLQDWKDFIVAQRNAGTPIEICYELATPFEIQLTPQQVRSLYGNNTIFADTGNVALEYWAHP